MNQLVKTFNTSELTMTSREIAELTGKRHDNILRDIRAMLTDIHGEGGLLKFEGTYIHTQNGNEYTEYRLPKDETICLLTGYDAKARFNVVKRWQELESQSFVRLPNFNNPAEAARAWAEVYEEKSKLALEHQVALEENTHLKSHFIDGMKIVDFSRSLNGVNTMQLQNFLESKGWIRRDKKSGWRVNAQYRDRYLAERTSIFKNPNTEEEQERHYPILLRAGAVKLFKMYSEGLLPMKANWNGSIGHGDEVLR